MNNELQLFRKTLKQNGLFNTKARYQLFLALQNHTSLPVTELVKRLPDHDPATVYRNIKLFKDLGIVTFSQQGWRSRLELSDRFHRHHHHLTCRRCGQVLIMEESPELETLLNRLSAKNNFKATDHQLEIRGLCHNCQQKV